MFYNLGARFSCIEAHTGSAHFLILTLIVVQVHVLSLPENHLSQRLKVNSCGRSSSCIFRASSIMPKFVL